MPIITTTAELQNGSATLERATSQGDGTSGMGFAISSNHTVTATTKPHKQEPQQQLPRSSNNTFKGDYDNQIVLDDKDSSHFQTFRADSSSPPSCSTTDSIVPVGEKPNDNGQQQRNNLFLIKSRNQLQRQVWFKSLLASTTVISESDENCLNIVRQQQNDGQELINFANFHSAPTTTHCDIIRQEKDDYLNIELQHQLTSHNNHSQTTTFSDHSNCDISQDHELTGGNFFDVNDEDDNLDNRSDLDGRPSINSLDDDSTTSPSHHRLKSARKRQRTVINRLLTKVKIFTTGLSSKISSSLSSVTSDSNQIPYSSYIADQDNQQVSGTRKYKFLGSSKVAAAAQSKRHSHISSERSFRGPYRYSRLGIVMALLKRLFSFLIQRSTLALFGAFLIHITLGTVYTLSNVNSYLTSYMRAHETPNATYGSSMWMSSSYAVGQGLSMVLGGYLEKRFSARLACILGCLLHSLSIMSTSISVDYGQLAVLLTYGLLPGFGCGLAYMTPMSNGFGWFPHRKGLVAGVILAGFGIGTFVFNMAQTAFVNPNNLSPPPNAGGYFTQEPILNRVPLLFVFLGTIYASMQFVGCCLMFKPPSANLNDCINKAELHDERPLLASPDEIGTGGAGSSGGGGGSLPISHMPFRKAIRTREFLVLFTVFGVTNQGVLFVNSMLKEYAQLFINDDMYLAWAGSMASIANSLGRLFWGLAIDRYSFTQCFTATTTIFGTLMFLMPFEFILSSKLFYLLCTLGVFGSFSGWMSTYPVHLSRVFGVKNSGMIYGLIFVSQVSRAAVVEFSIELFSTFSHAIRDSNLEYSTRHIFNVNNCPVDWRHHDSIWCALSH